MTGHGEKLTRKQEGAIAALLTDPTVTAAAERARVGERTLRRWLQLPVFIRAFRDARRAVVESAISRLQHSTAAAVDALERNLACGRPGDEIRAAVAILDHAYRGAELLDLAERVADLEGRQP